MILKRIFKGLALLFLIFLLVSSAFVAYLFISPNLHLEQSMLLPNTPSITLLDSANQEICLPVSAKERVEINGLPEHVVNAFVAVEDKRFFKHNGVDFIGVLRAFKSNLLSRSLKEGGSTITQQLIKNTYLTNEKTLNRKIKEIKLALKAEKQFSKEEILSFYLNSVYFGEGAYGIESASKSYFNKSASELSLVEACALASTVKAPSVYNPRKEKCEKRKNLVLNLMLEQGYISNEQYQRGISTKITVKDTPKSSDYAIACIEEIYDKLSLSPYENCKILAHTYYEKDCQTALESTLDEKNQGGIIMNNQGKILGYKIPEGDFERAPASTIKPLIVYAPAIEEGIVHLATKILDESCSFSGYTPKNYGDKYYGWVSVKDCICKSLNVPAIKVIDSLGTQKARLYARKLNIQIEEEGLGIALGSYNGGVTLQALCSAYTPFLAEGNFYSSTFIKEIFIDEKRVYQDDIASSKVFSAGTCEIINQALKECAISGTARAIGKRDYEVCAKTGTLGNEKGNTDAYTVCYTSEHLIALRFCNKDNSLMTNSISGGYVAKYASNILDDIYSNHTPAPFNNSNEVTYADMCLLAYEEGALQLSDKSLSNKYVFTTPILTKYLKSLPISSFSTPSATCDIQVNGNKVRLTFNKKDYVKIKIEKSQNGSFELLTVTENTEFTDIDLKDGKYLYKITPIFTDSNGNEILGKEIILPEIIIKREEDFKNSNWWEDD